MLLQYKIILNFGLKSKYIALFFNLCFYQFLLDKLVSIKNKQTEWARTENNIIKAG